MDWPLTWVVVVGTLPGVFLGSWVRIMYLPDPRAFKVFVGAVILYLGVRLVIEFTGGLKKQKAQNKALDQNFSLFLGRQAVGVSAFSLAIPD